MPTSSLDMNCRISDLFGGNDDDDDNHFDDHDDSNHVVYGLAGRGHKGLVSGGASAALPNSGTHNLTSVPDVGPASFDSIAVFV